MEFPNFVLLTTLFASSKPLVQFQLFVLQHHSFRVFNHSITNNRYYRTITYAINPPYRFVLCRTSTTTNKLDPRASGYDNCYRSNYSFGWLCNPNANHNYICSGSYCVPHDVL